MTHAITSATTPLFVSGPDHSPVRFVLEVPGVLRRLYHGTLAVRGEHGMLAPVVCMNREVAVASVVTAELPALRSGVHAQIAQAVVARSFLEGILLPRHSNAFFCDTTHCQFLRSAVPPSLPVQRSLQETDGLVLSAADVVVPASYSAACGGVTKTGVRDGYVYKRVQCPICIAHRLPRRGHGWGLCQEGAMGLAARGATWREIVSLYFPSAVIRQI